MDNYYITKKDDKWQFKKQGSDRAIKNSSTKKDIVSYMQQYMKNKKGSVKIQGIDGKFQEERTYPRLADSRKSKG